MSELIDRQSALSVCKEYCLLDDDDFIDGYNTAIKDIREAIKELPTIEPEARRGRWIKEASDMFDCSECGESIYWIFCEKKCSYGYCPNCGARMVDSVMMGDADNG